MSADRWLGSEHWHDKFGRVMLAGLHPYDGAVRIVMVAVDDDAPEDSCYRTVEGSELRPLPDRTWPYLGFITEEISDSCSAPWATKHGIEERPRGSGQWFHTATDLRVVGEFFRKAHEEDFNEIYSAELAKHGIFGQTPPAAGPYFYHFGTGSFARRAATVHKSTAVGQSVLPPHLDWFDSCKPESEK